MSDFRKANELEPGSIFALAGLAISRHAIGYTEEAKRLWKLLVSMDANYMDADWMKKELRWAEPLVEEARKLIAKL